MKTVLTIAGSDCSGGAGIQADIKTMAALGVYGMSVITAVVAENTQRVLSTYAVPNVYISDQLDAIFWDIEVDAVKIGMLPSGHVMKLVAHKLKRFRPIYIVVDPVMRAKDGTYLMREDAIDTFCSTVLPLSDVITPNIPEAERITGIEINCMTDMKRAAQKIVSMGAKAALVKGGHSEGDCEDVLYDGNAFYAFSHKRIKSKNTHGTGCTLSSAIASFLARGYGVSEAVSAAKEYVTGAIENGLDIGKGHGPMNHFFNRKGDK